MIYNSATEFRSLNPHIYVLLKLDTATKMYIYDKVCFFNIRREGIQKKGVKREVCSSRGLKNEKALAFYPKAPACLYCQPSGCNGMTPPAFPERWGLKCQAFPSKGHRHFCTIWCFQVSWAGSLLRAILLLGTQQGSCRLSGTFNLTGAPGSFFPTLHPPRKVENILLRAL